MILRRKTFSASDPYHVELACPHTASPIAGRRVLMMVFGRTSPIQGGHEERTGVRIYFLRYGFPD